MSEIIFDLNSGRIAYVNTRISDLETIQSILEKKTVEEKIYEELGNPSQQEKTSTKKENARKFKKGMVKSLAKKRREIEEEKKKQETITTVLDIQGSISIKTTKTIKKNNIWDEIEQERKKIVKDIEEKRQQEEEKRLGEIQREKEERENRIAAKALLELAKSLEKKDATKESTEEEIAVAVEDIELLFEEKKPRTLSRIVTKRKFDDMQQIKETSEQRRERVFSNFNPTKTGRKTKRSKQAAEDAKIQLNSGIVTPFAKFGITWDQYYENREYFDDFNNVQ